MNGDRQRAIAYHDLERLEDDEALRLHGAARLDESSQPRDDARAATTGSPVRRGWTPTLSAWLTDHERRERWPIG
jgi:hypothetical protein